MKPWWWVTIPGPSLSCSYWLSLIFLSFPCPKFLLPGSKSIQCTCPFLLCPFLPLSDVVQPICDFTKPSPFYLNTSACFSTFPAATPHCTFSKRLSFCLPTSLFFSSDPSWLLPYHPIFPWTSLRHHHSFLETLLISLLTKHPQPPQRLSDPPLYPFFFSLILFPSSGRCRHSSLVVILVSLLYVMFSPVFSFVGVMMHPPTPFKNPHTRPPCQFAILFFPWCLPFILIFSSPFFSFPISLFSLTLFWISYPLCSKSLSPPPFSFVTPDSPPIFCCVFFSLRVGRVVLSSLLSNLTTFVDSHFPTPSPSLCAPSPLVFGLLNPKLCTFFLNKPSLKSFFSLAYPFFLSSNDICRFQPWTIDFLPSEHPPPKLYWTLGFGSFFVTKRHPWKDPLSLFSIFINHPNKNWHPSIR